MRRMKILFIIALLSFAALAGAAFAITRHIRKNSKAVTAAEPRSEDVDAMTQRLTAVARPAAEDRSSTGMSSGQRDFAYFNRDAPEKPERAYSDIPYPETADRPRKNAADHL